MNILMSFKMAESSIVSNKARSALTMLGIIIGVLAVIVMVNLVTASTMSMKEWMDQMAQNILEVNIWNSNDTTRRFDPSDMQKLAAETDSIEYQTPSVSGNVSVKNANRTFNNGIEGVNEHYADIMRRELSYGSFFSESDVNLRMPVAVIGEYVRQSLFGTRNPVGQDIKIGGEIFKVVGVLEQKSSELSEWGEDAKVYIPYTKALRLLKRTNVDMYYVSVEDPSESGVAQTAIENALYNAYQSRDYWVYNQAEHMQEMNSEIQGMTLLAAAIAGISLLVGGIGIMNIMLVSVTERTKEIGIRKAVGARTSTILSQFLIESSMISCVGGTIGILLGIVASEFATMMMDLPSVPMVQQMPVIMAAFCFSAVVGIFFGMYPASKAARMNPVDALRYE